MSACQDVSIKQSSKRTENRLESIPPPRSPRAHHHSPRARAAPAADGEGERGTALSPAWSWQRRIPSGCLWLLLVILSGVVPFLVHYNLDNLVSGLCFHVVVPFLFGGRVRVATLRARVATWVCVREGEKARGSREFVQCAEVQCAVCSAAYGSCDKVSATTRDRWSHHQAPARSPGMHAQVRTQATHAF